MYCLSLYGCPLWSLSSKSLNCLQIALNKILRKVWNLPLRSHSSVVHCIARVPSVTNIVLSRFDRFLSSISQLTSPIVFDQVAVLPYNFLGYNNLYGENYFKIYSSFDQDISSFIRSIRVKHGMYHPLNSLSLIFLACSLSLSLSSFSFCFIAPFLVCTTNNNNNNNKFPFDITVRREKAWDRGYSDT